MELGMEGGVGTRFGVCLRLQDTTSLALTLSAQASIPLISIPSSLSTTIISHLPLSCPPSLPITRLNQPPTGVMVKPELRRQVLYNASPVEDFILASMLLRPSPARALPSVNVVRNDSLENIVVLRVFIIKTMKDKLFKPERQENMIKQWPPSKVFAIDESDHSPFFSTPDMLFPLLLEAAISIKMP
ncbi:pheophorbidase-like isoform X3 [Humulus lupulus]|uniref:pheophorbidase-like isoform X3 n=1 Tax=Humulus lupulus TaxID=3486 RepID=UPI002B405FF2|nr:pheophorbidase-like isoform X3 [Humulus lupulus]